MKIFAKSISIILVCAVLVGCTGQKPKGMTNDDYQLAKQIIAMTDDVFDNNADACDVGNSIKAKSKGFENSSLKTYGTCVGTSLVTYSLGSCSSKDVIDTRNTIAEYINEKKR